MPFVRYGHMIRNKLCWYANNPVGLPKLTKNPWVYLGVRTCELFLYFVAIVKVRAIMLTSLLSFFHVTGEFHRFLHRGRAELLLSFISKVLCHCVICLPA